MLGREALSKLAKLSQLMVAKMDEPISHVRGWINSKISIVFRILYPRMIRGSKLTSTLQDRDPDWDPASGFGLAH